MSVNASRQKLTSVSGEPQTWDEDILGAVREVARNLWQWLYTQKMTRLALIFEGWTTALEDTVYCNRLWSLPAPKFFFLRLYPCMVTALKLRSRLSDTIRQFFFMQHHFKNMTQTLLLSTLEWSFGSWVLLGRMRWMAQAVYSRARLF